MEEESSRLQAVTQKLLRRVEGLLDEVDMEPQTLKHLAAVLKDVKEIQKDAHREADTESVTVTLEGEVGEFGA